MDDSVESCLAGADLVDTGESPFGCVVALAVLSGGRESKLPRSRSRSRSGEGVCLDLARLDCVEKLLCDCGRRNERVKDCFCACGATVKIASITCSADSSSAGPLKPVKP